MQYSNNDLESIVWSKNADSMLNAQRRINDTIFANKFVIPEEIKDKPGVRQWTLKIPAGQKQELNLSYRIKHPVEMQVAGL